MISYDSAEEYLFTIGILVAFFGLIVSIIRGRSDLAGVLRSSGMRRRHSLAMLLVVLAFLIPELLVVNTTQQLFFDDVIYQSMAVTLIHTGQAWMCNYGNAFACYSGQVFHEPIGTSFNLAIAFLIAGANRTAAYATEIVLAVIALVSVFLVSLVMFKDPRAAIFSEAFLALSPLLLVWGKPTTSDLPSMAYALVAVLFMLVFLRKRNVDTFGMAAFSLALATYMKATMAVLVVVIPVMYLIMEHGSIRRRLSGIYDLARRNIYNTRLLVVILLFVVAIGPELGYAYNKALYGTYDYQGTYIQDSCAASLSLTQTKGTFNLQNFEYNVCGNILFWTNHYESSFIMQPLIFSIIGVLGAVSMLILERRAFLSIGFWFLSFFLLYAFFYAGGVTYGVDWRFMLSLIAQVSLFAGFFVAAMLDAKDRILLRLVRRWRGAAFRIYHAVAEYSIILLVALLMVYPLYAMWSRIAVTPNGLPQAGDARFYESFVYNESHLINSSCLVFSYDPTLFILNNRTSTQLSNVYNSTLYDNLSLRYSCMVFDRGYWCYTPDSLCQNINSTFNLTPIVTANYTQMSKTFGFYYLKKKA